MLTRRRFWSTLLALSLLAGPLSAIPARADQLDDLRRSGALGERFDGFVEARDAGASGFADQINAQRRQAYEQIAAQQGTSVDQVGRIAAKKILDRLPSGVWFKSENGSWGQI